MRKKQKITKTTMVKKLFLFLAITAGFVTSCKDYDDDIDNLQEQIDGITADLDGIQDLVAAGKFVQKVETTATGIKITFSDNTTATINNGTNGTDGADGADGADGTVISIGNDGYWYIDNVKTDVKAAGIDGADGQDGADGLTPSIGENGNWFIGETDTNIKAAGENGADGLTPYVGLNGNWFIGETDTNVKASPDVVTIGEDGYWQINGDSTGVLANPGSIVALLNEDGTYYTITVFNQDGSVSSSISIPVVAQYVSSISMVPDFVSIGNEGDRAYIYAPIFKKGATTLTSAKAKISYQVNPSSVQESNFDEMGLVKKEAQFVMRSTASSYLPVTRESYSNGLLTVRIPTTELPAVGAGTNPDLGSTMFYALVVKNKLEDGTTTEKLVYSDYAPVAQRTYDLAAFATQPSNNGTDNKRKLEITKTDGTAFSGISTTPDWQFTYNSADGATLSVTSSYEDLSYNRFELKDFFDNITYTYAFDNTASGHANNLFTLTTLDANAGTANIKVTNGAAAAINQFAAVKVSLYIGSDLMQTKTIYVTAVNRIATETTIFTKSVSYVRGTTLINVPADGYSENLFINAIDNYGLSYVTGVTAVDEFTDADGDPVAGISFVGDPALATGGTVSVQIVQTLAAGTYYATRTYTTADESKWHAKYTITLTDGDINFNASKVSAYWNGALNTEVVYGRQSGAYWSMQGDLDDGFNFATLIPSPVPSVGSALTISSYSYAIITDATHLYTGVSINSTSHVISLSSNYADYVDGTAVPVRLTVIYNNLKTYTHDFLVQFKNPIRIEYKETLTFSDQDYANDRTGISPWEGVTVTNLATNTVVTDYEDLEVLLNTGTISSTAIDDATYDISGNLSVRWDRFNVGFIIPNWIFGSMGWNNTGTALQQNLNAAYNISYATRWGQTISLTNVPLRVIVTPASSL